MLSGSFYEKVVKRMKGIHSIRRGLSGFIINISITSVNLIMIYYIRRFVLPNSKYVHFFSKEDEK